MPDYLNFTADWSSPDAVAVYDELPFWSAMAGLLLLENLPLRPGLTVLDLGPGTGFPLFDLAQRLGSDSIVVGLDPWREALGRARLKQRVWHVPNAHIVLGDAAAMPLPDSAFDLVVSNLGLNNFDDAPAAVAECHRVMTPGATIAITTNLRGHMREFYAAFESTLRDLGLTELLKPLRHHIAHRATVESVRDLFEASAISPTRVVQREVPMRFANGSALLRHHFIKLGFLDAWKAVVPEADRARVFETVEANLNQLATERGDLTLTIPLAYIEGTRA